MECLVPGYFCSLRPLHSLDLALAESSWEEDLVSPMGSDSPDPSESSVEEEAS